jgi:glycosyltransferase involved in cell wall biosynthesis
VKQGFLIPVYRHAKIAGPLAEKLAAFGLPIILVDDGNDEESGVCLVEWAAKIPQCTLVRLEKNSGKGEAFAKGLEKAAELGLDHVLQLDADGQHDTSKVVFFLEEAERNPEKIICGIPEFDASAPKSRVNGRKVSNFWAAIVTLSGELKDALCGFRVYPVLPSLSIMKNPLVDRRMGFDAEILVRLYWKGIFPVFYPVHVSYPADGISNFRIVRDNVHISWMFTRLFVGMLIRLPLLLVLNMRRKKNHGKNRKA